MSVDNKSPKRNRISLRRRYLMASAFVCILVILAAIMSNWHTRQVSIDNTSALQTQVYVNKMLSVVRGALWQIDISMNTMLVSPLPEHEKKITKNINLVRNEVAALAERTDIINLELREGIEKLSGNINLFVEKIEYLLGKRKDSAWVYPILPYVNDKLLISNGEFENASEIILHSISEEDGRPYASVRFGQFDQLRDAWRYKILNFRMFLIRFAGLGQTRSSPQEINIERIHEVIEDKLSELAALQEKGELDFDSELALETMQKASAKWYKNWQHVKTFRANKVWRNDTDYMETEIRPLQKQIFTTLTRLDNELLSMSSDNVRAVQDTANVVSQELWLFSALALVFVIGIYLMIDRSILRPISRISDALSAEGQQTDYELERQGSKEIHQLATSFLTMRKQIHHRQEELQTQALHDALTGLPNRTLFTDRLEQALKDMHRTKQHMSVLLLDLDRFKDINDVLGHPIGDRLLQEVSKRLSDVARESDTVARFGGDEFAIVLPSTNEKEAAQFAARIVNSINEVFTIESNNLYVGVSIGIAVYPEHGDDVDTLVRHSDVAMYVAKRGRHDFSIYKESYDKGYAEDLVLVEALHSELDNTEFLNLYYQPQIDLFSRELVGIEALLRWKHPVLGVISPENIVQIAENSGQIDRLTDWIIRTAVKEFHEIIDIGQLRFSINLSAKNLQDEEMPSRIEDLLKSYAISASSLTLEITESAMMSDPACARETMNKLSAMGIELSVDDYGTGFSSLGYLKLLPVNELKIDKSFVINMLEDENDAIIVHSTIELAHNLGLKVVAEGVENIETLQKLRGLKCDIAQGYFISQPMSKLVFNQWLEAYNPKVVNSSL